MYQVCKSFYKDRENGIIARTDIIMETENENEAREEFKYQKSISTDPREEVFMWIDEDGIGRPYKATSDAQKRAAAKYDAQHTMRVFIKLNKETDADILQRLEQVPNKQGYIKALIRRDIEAQG